MCMFARIFICTEISHFRYDVNYLYHTEVAVGTQTCKVSPTLILRFPYFSLLLHIFQYFLPAVLFVLARTIE